MGTLASSEDQDEMQHNAELHQGLHCFLRLKQFSGDSICDPLKYKTGNTILISLIYIGTSIKIQRVNFSKKFF